MNAIQVFVTHYVSNDTLELNDVLVEEIQYLEHTTKYPHETTVVYYAEGGSADELFDRLPKNVKIIKNDRAGRNDIQPSLRNKVVELAEDGKYFILLHNDIRVTVGWLDNLGIEMKNSEEKYGKGNCVITPRYIPYWYIGSNGERIENNNFRAKYPEFWKEFQDNVCCLNIDKMRDFCNNWKFKFDGINVYSDSTPNCQYVTDDAHQLMMFMGTKKCFNDIGECDESFVGINYDDQDWGIRALLADKKNLQSQTCLIGHVQGLSFCHKNISTKRSCNDNVFINKWGRALFDEMQTGDLWTRLHNEQNQKLRGV